MIQLTTPVVDELRDLLVNVLSLASSVVVVKATKFIRYDWRSLVQQFEKCGSGLEPPWIVMRTFPTEEADWGQANHCLHLPVQMFMMDDERNAINTNVRTGDTGNVQQVANTIRMFPEQWLYFTTSNQWAKIQSVDSSIQVTLASSITTVTNEDITSDITKDVEVKIEVMRNRFIPGQVFSSFQLMDDPMTDVSDLNPANEYFESEDHNILCGSCYIRPLVGLTP